MAQGYARLLLRQRLLFQETTIDGNASCAAEYACEVNLPTPVGLALPYTPENLAPGYSCLLNRRQ